MSHEMKRTRRWPIVALLLATAAGAWGQQHDTAGGRPGPIELRKRLHVNPLITPPDTAEVEWGGAFATGGSFTFPAAFRFTPEGHHVYWGRTELSVIFDSLSYDGTATHFGDRTTLGATCVLHDGDKFDFAIEPTTSLLLRGDTGIRAGATAIARYDTGQSSAGITVGWTGATRVSATNPAGTTDVGVGYGYQLRASGPLSHLTAHTNLLWERSTGTDWQISVFEGVEYQITDLVAVDFSAQHVNVWGGQPEHDIVVGLTVNTHRINSLHQLR